MECNLCKMKSTNVITYGMLFTFKIKEDDVITLTGILCLCIIKDIDFIINSLYLNIINYRNFIFTILILVYILKWLL